MIKKNEIYALLIPILTLVIHKMTWVWVKPHIWFAYYFSLFLSTKIGGEKGGYYATGLTAFIVYFFEMEPLYSFQKNSIGDYVSMIFFIIVGIALSRTVGSLNIKMKELKIASAAFYSKNGVVITDKKGKILKINQAYIQMSGYSESELIGNTPSLLKSDMYDSSFYKQLWIDLEKKNAWEGEIVNKTKNGELFHIFLNITKIIQTEDDEIYYVGVMKDISKRKQLEKNLQEQKEQFEAMFQTSIDGIALLDLNSNFLKVNRAYCTMTGYTQEELLKKSCIEMSIAGDVERSKNAMKEVFEKGYIENFEKQCFTKEGEPFLVNMSLSMMPDKSSILAISKNITKNVILGNVIEQQKRRYEQIMKLASDGIFILSLNGKLFDCSQRAADMLGYSMQEMKQLWIFDWDTQYTQEKVLQYIRSIPSEPIKFETKYKRKNGTVYDAEVVAVTITIEEQEYVYASVRDVTEENRAKMLLTKAENKFHTLFEESSDGIVLLNVETKKFIEFNSKVLQMYGYTEDEFRELSFKDLDIFQTEEQILQIQHNILEKGWDKFTSQHRAKNGNIRDVIVNIRLFNFDNDQVLVVIVHDITEQKRLESNLIAAKEEAEKATRLKSGFLANMSHEIRTPLNGVIGINILLLKTDLTEQQQDYLKRSLQSAQSLLGLINDILDYSKIEAGKLELSNHPFSLEEVLHTVSGLFEYSIVQKGMEIHIDLDPLIPKMIEGDSLRLSQILNNLVGNAVKFTEHGDIVIHAKLLELRNQVITLQFSVSDTGIGIDQEEKSMLFHAFSQTDASNTRKYGGTGLGLAISKQLVEMMNGKIWLESIKGEGTTFYFTVQLELSEYQILKALPESFAHKRFLILEDNEIEGQFIVDILESWNIHPILCSNGTEALEIAQKTPLDYMLIDWRVPVLDGFDVLERLHDGRLDVIPKVIMISALMKEDLKEKARMRKVLPHAILHKPITASLLLNALVMEEDAMLSIDSLSSESMEKHFTGNILMVEDNEINQLVERGLLEGYGIAVDLAVNGLDAIEKCKNKTYDLIFMDLQMPVMDGFEAAKNIRFFDMKTPIVALSAAVMKHDKELTIAAGMNHHLSKPIDIEELEMILSRYLPVTERPVTNKSVANGPFLSFEGIDMPHLYKIYKDEEKILNYLKLFAKTQRNFCTHVEQYSIGSTEFKAAIHTFKGVSGNVAAIKLHETAVHIENSDDEDTIKELLHTLCDDLNELIVEIDQCNVSHQMHTHEFLDTANTIKLIDSTLAKLESNEFIDDDEIENLVYAVKPYLSEIVAAKLLEALNLFEFSVAIALLQTLKKDIYE